MKKMKRMKRICTLLLAIMLTLGLALQMGIGGVFAENQNATTTNGSNDYIYFDLAAGNVNIGKDNYSGYVYVNGNPEEVKGDHDKDNKYYVYQSNMTDSNSEAYYEKTGYKSDADVKNGEKCIIPVYPRVKNGSEAWTDYITNNTNVKEVSENWGTVAKDFGRTSTPYNITFAQESGYTADVTVDNIWSRQHDKNTSRTTGGIGAHLDDQTGTSINLHLRGDNRVGCVHYSSDRGSGNHITFSNDDDPSTPGSITVADFPNQWDYNHWNAAIGAADNPANSADMSEGIVIDSGVIYAGTTPEDNCTAIGGGGNQYGSVTINNGEVTAVVSSTGTAIGGGIGYSNKGGDTDVIINDGEIYAYNLGITTDTDTVHGGFKKFVPAAAIGGGGSNGEAGGLTANITITGGKIYAQSMGGAAIGGGCSANDDGGPATINITGGTIIAKSTGGTYGTDKIDPGVSIGGGTGETGGGSVTLNISGKDTKLRTGSIGGGKTTGSGNIGSAWVTINGGDITGQVIMAKGAGNPCSFDMTDGKIHSTDVTEENAITDITDPKEGVKVQYIEENGGAVWMDDPEGVTNITGGTIEGCTAKNGGAIWMNGGTLTLSGTETKITGNTAQVFGNDTGMGGAICMHGGKADIEGGTISGNTAQSSEANANTGMGGAIYLPGGDFTLNGGTISGNNAKNGGGIYLSKAPTLNGGTISGNTATENGGGLYIENSLVTLKPAESKELYVKENKAVNGAGIYIHGTKSGTELPGGSEAGSSTQVDVVTGATKIPEDAVGLLVSKDTEGQLYFTNNNATGSGGAVCVDTKDKKSRFELDTNHITVTGNKAVNGGGVAVLNGNFTMTAGSIGSEGENGANTAKNGGGVYVSGGDIWFKGGSIKHNVATQNGGGAYVAGNYNMLAGEVMLNAATKNGGGIYVNDGTVTMYGGKVDSNIATENGGGMHISSTAKNALVDIFSGSISGNESKKSGGGVSVVSSSGSNIDVTVGVNCEHNLKEDGSYEKFLYPEAGNCGKAHNIHSNHISNIDGNQLEHSSCPQVKGNTATKNGGGFFLNSPNSAMTIYCLQAQGNTAPDDPDSDCMKVEGGKLQIGDEDFDIHKSDHQDSGAKGNTTIEGTIMVEGGQVDVYGEMENPKFTQDVKVDVTKQDDHYLDHRIIEKGYTDYKVHYYENFKGDGDTPTGLYIARQYPDKEHADKPDDEKYKFTVMSSIFTHPGYKIVGWNTKPDDTGTKYEVNGTYDLSELAKDQSSGLGAGFTVGGTTYQDEQLLILYAIWERSEYVLKFDPNVGAGESYTGTMEDQPVMIAKHDGSQKIRKNEFKRPGYKFSGWTLSPNPADSDKVYTDGEAITTDFTTEDGATVTLYAKWEKCTHVDSLIYTVKDNVLTQSCSVCGGHTATATLSAVNSTYDGEEHLATADFSDNWIGTKPTISYEMAANDKWDRNDGVKNEWDSTESTNRKPLHAGTYTAKITGQNDNEIAIEGNTKATADVNYTISPVKWETPAVPVMTFSVEKLTGSSSYNNIITITEPTGANVMYQIKQISESGDEIGVEDHLNWQSGREFTNIPLGKYYYFYAKVCADRDHLESDYSKSTAYLADGGNVIYIENGAGIKVVPKYGTGKFQYMVSAEEGYHLREYEDNLENDEMTIGLNKPGFVEPIPGVEGNDAYIKDGGIIIKRSKPTNGNDPYQYTVELVNGKVAYHQITLKFSGAAKNASVDHKVTDGQVFRDFNNKENTSISCDSAFTAQFKVSDYIPAEYEEPVLKFSEALPENTTVIMKTDDGKYWHYKLDMAAAGTQNDSIKLTDFTAMGGTDHFTFDTADTSAEAFTYQFIVDFSQSAGAAVTTDPDKLKVDLNLVAKTSTDSSSQSAPTIPADGNHQISLDIKDKAGFEIPSVTAPGGKSATINCSYNPSAGAASIWNGRKTALVLTAPQTTPIPDDLTLTAVVDGSTTIYTMNANKQFIIPLGKVGPDKITKQVQVTLNSDQFSSSGGDLTFKADWYVSQSGVGKSPLNGDKVTTYENIRFSCKKDAVPSVRIDGKKHHCKVGGELNVTVRYKSIPIRGKIVAYLQSKESDGTYDYTGAQKDIATRSILNEEEITFKMGKMSPGSYRILVIVSQGGANILQVPYYFVITE